MIQDFTETLDPGESRHLTFGAVDFVFCRQADVPVEFIVDQQTTTLETGGEFESRDGLFSRATIRNPSNKRPVTVRLKMGTSRYRQVIIQGEVVIDPRVKTATGDFVSDQRSDHQVFVAMDYKREPIIPQGAVVKETEVSASTLPEGYRAGSGGTYDGDTARFFYDGTNNYFISLDRSTGEVISQSVVPGISGSFDKMKCGVPYGSTWYCGASDGYVYQILEGDTEDRTSGDRVSNFQCEGSFWSNVFKGPNGDLWGMDTDYKYYNITAGYKAFTSGNGQNRTGFAIGADVYTWDTNDNIEKWSQNSAGTWESQGLVYTLASRIRAAVFIEYNASEKVCDYFAGFSVDETYLGGYFEPEGYGEGEIHYGVASETCLALPRLYNPGIEHDARTDASVSVEFKAGLAFASGQVLKYTLDLLGIDTSGDYLDGITGFQARTKTGEIKVNLGGRTFSADEIQDDFQDIELPQTLTITALDSLWSKKA